MRGRPDTFLPFMKYWWSRVVDAVFIRVAECFSAALVHTFLSHEDLRIWKEVDVKENDC